MENKTPEQIKELVKQQYSQIALQEKDQNESSCCGSTCCSTDVYNIMSDDYSKLEGYNPEADLGLGCGLPTQFAKIAKGNVVIDLGSGAGNDCFVARQETGDTGKVIGIDFTPAMIDKARINAEKLGYHNIEFRQGDIENLPVTSNVADVVVSNCVLNLVPDKVKAYSEVFRVLKPGGHFSISDVVLEGALPKTLMNVAEMYAGCISGAIQKDVYLKAIHDAGFKNVTIQKQKAILLPDDILKEYLSESDIKTYKESGVGIFSITVYGEKEKKDQPCCPPGCCN
ncbi:MAG: arsenite methyltransferase [Bacteroidetes bacterium]|nr:arsenite methyltransferase [Bacteroidota bacterium]MBK9414599.1 arsenite methyltransferase [Bacteroidota bacterium]MBP6426890.1 arsenite methyltransferase [Bacteroidia bacterium]MBP6658115.1 arsenite methyltransferase [Bacteroidia bacterium]